MEFNIIPGVFMNSNNKVYGVVGHIYRILSDSEQTQGTYTLIEALIPPEDPGPPPHTHSGEDESFYVIEGEFTFFIGEREIRAKTGDFVHGPRNVRHTFKNSSSAQGRLLVILNPSGFERFFEEVGDPVEPGTQPPVKQSSGHIEKVINTAPKYGLTLHL